MKNVDIDTDRDQATMTVRADFDAPVDHVWQLVSDPRKLERWWGPPTHPATVVEHDLEPGGRVLYYMTGPENERYHGVWRVLSVQAPTDLEVEDAFADAEGNPSDEMPLTTMQINLSAVEGGTRMTIRSNYASTEAMEQVLEMGVLDGLQEAMSQIDGILAEIHAS